MTSKKRPTIFIGSSKEGKKYVEAIEAEFFHDDYDVLPWYRLFKEPLLSNFEELEKLRDIDFAILLMTPDDILHTRGEEAFTPRDNIILELGLLVGYIGRNRVFPIIPKEPKIKIPSDLLGTNPLTFRFSNKYKRLREYQAAISVACSHIRDEIELKGLKKDTNYNKQGQEVKFKIGCDEFQFFLDRNYPSYPYTIPKIISQATNGGSIIVIARTCRSWLTNKRWRRMISDGINTGNLTCKFILMDPFADIEVLSKQERQEFKKDLLLQLENIRDFSTVFEKHKEDFGYFLTPTTILESITYLEGEEDNRQIKRFFLDIYLGTTHIGHRPTLVITHFSDIEPQEKCLINPLINRFQRMIESSGLDAGDDEINKTIDILDERDFEPSRSNPAIRLLPRLPEIFEYMDNLEPWLGKKSFLDIQKFSLLPPLCVQIEISDKCNTNGCVFCSRGKRNQTKQENPYMKINLFKKIAKELKNMSCRNIVISGGEPLLHPRIKELLQICNKHNLNVALLTDGLLLSDNKIRQSVIETVSSLRISFDGSNNKTYTKVRWLPKSKWPSPIETFEKMMVKLNDERENNEINKNLKLNHVGICITLCQQNVNEIREIFDWVYEMEGIDSIVFKFAHGIPSDIWSPKRNDFLCTPAQVNKVKKFLEYIKDTTLKKDVNVDYMLKYISMVGKKSIASGKPMQKLYNKENIICFMPEIISLIDPHGRVYPCCHLYYDNSKTHNNRQKWCMGDLNEDDFQTIWSSRDYNEFRLCNVNKLHDNNIVKSKCQMFGECTRHWKQNFFLTQIYRDYQKWSLGSREIFENLAHSSGEINGFWL